MMDYWPWWAGAMALGSITVLYHVLVGRRFGVSSSWERVVHWKVERAVEQMDARVRENSAAFEAALREATVAEFGEGGDGDVLTTTPPATTTSTPSPTPTATTVGELDVARHDSRWLLCGSHNQRSFPTSRRHGPRLRRHRRPRTAHVANPVYWRDHGWYRHSHGRRL